MVTEIKPVPELKLDFSILEAKLIYFKKAILEKIDFEDRLFINRGETLEKLMKDPKIDALSESISATGLINHVYLQEKEKDTYRILSGFRRSIAIKKCFETIDNFKLKGQVIIIPADATKDELERISIHENLHRQDLKLRDLSFKIYKDSVEENQSFEEIASKYKISPGYVKRLKAAVSYDKELINILGEVGIKKAELLNRIIKKLKCDFTTEDILKEYKDCSSKDLEREIKDLKSKEEKSKYEITLLKKGANIKLNQSLTEDQQEKLEEFLRNL
jgi:ParB-like chromosome segregation protein Spo0J